MLMTKMYVDDLNNDDCDFVYYYSFCVTLAGIDKNIQFSQST